MFKGVERKARTTPFIVSSLNDGIDSVGLVFVHKANEVRKLEERWFGRDNERDVRKAKEASIHRGVNTKLVDCKFPLRTERETIPWLIVSKS